MAFRVLWGPARFGTLSLLIDRFLAVSAGYLGPAETPFDGRMLAEMLAGLWPGCSGGSNQQPVGDARETDLL